MCGNFTPTESLQTNFVKFTKLYFFTVKMDDEDDDDIIIAATCLLLSCTTQVAVTTSEKRQHSTWVRSYLLAGSADCMQVLYCIHITRTTKRTTLTQFTMFSVRPCTVWNSFPSALYVTFACHWTERFGESLSFIDLLDSPDWFHSLSDHLMFLFCSTTGFVCMMC